MDKPGDIGKYKLYVYYEDRISSFDAWSQQIIPDKCQLARSGSFFILVLGTHLFVSLAI